MSQDGKSQASQPTTEPQDHAKATQGKLGVVAHTCNPSIQENRSGSGSHPAAHSTTPLQTDSAALATDVCHVGLGAHRPSLGLIPERGFQSSMTKA